MALRELTDAECGGRNPMLKVASHFTQDKAFRQEQFTPSFGSAERPVEDAMVKEFLEGIQAPSRPVGSNAFHMGTLLQEMRELERPGMHQFPIQAGPNVAEFAFKEESSWADDFLKNETHVLTENIPSASGWSQEFLDQPGYRDSETNYNAEWETQWDNLTSHIEKPNLAVQNSDVTQTASNIVANMDDPKFSQSEFLQFMQKVSQGEESLTTTQKQTNGNTSNTGQNNWADEFAVPNSEITTQEPNLDLDWAEEFITTNQTVDEKWSQEFTGGASAEVFKSNTSYQDDFWSQLQKDWDKAAEENPSLGWLKGTPLDPVNEYTFEAENPYQNHADPFNEGLQKKNEGDLPSAILLFEAALQKDPDHMKAWEMLGLSLAENEQDPGAITAYKRCLALESSNLVAIMGLAVSYTNESYQLQACQALEDWLRNNPKYGHLVSSSSQQDKLVGSLVSGDTFNRVQEMYMRAARLQPSANLDPDVQTGLGVLLNLSSDFEKAPDCFRAALQMKPNDSLLWNRLGATLANGGHSEEAVEAYYKALELSPGFIRARYNLAVSCINLGVHREATEHLVAALLHQGKRSKRVMSDNIWSTLRMVLNLMNRREFLADIDAR